MPSTAGSHNLLTGSHKIIWKCQRLGLEINQGAIKILLRVSFNELNWGGGIPIIRCAAIYKQSKGLPKIF